MSVIQIAWLILGIVVGLYFVLHRQEKSFAIHNGIVLILLSSIMSLISIWWAALFLVIGLLVIGYAVRKKYKSRLIVINDQKPQIAVGRANQDRHA